MNQDKEIKLAAVTEDGQNLSSHFGMAPFYRVFTIRAGQVVQETTLPKPHHGQHPAGEHGAHGHAHGDMFAPVQDCQALLCGGMGEPAYQSAKSLGLEVILTGGDIQDCVQAYLKGELLSDPRRVHRH
ncbi:MAG: NifB/NifX family molybdenum-iron cluster-binding protein [Anaerolineales bacterium]|nr:NifB/NifX family molybdenum-iron cluster-binding protein [Anaerolineales bacterium]